MMHYIIPEAENPILRKVARDIPQSEITSERITTLITEMKALLSKEEYGVALAAPQVGESLRLFIVSGKAVAKRSQSRKKRRADDDAKDTAKMPLEDQVYINPVFVKISRAKSNKHEGCLSLRGEWGVVPRAEKTTLRALDETGNELTRGASGFLAHIFQHEMDHLEGILYTDKAKEIYADEAESNE